MTRRRRGMTLIEMMVVVALIALIAGISFPALSSGLDTLRLRQSGDSVVALFNMALDRAERRQQPVELVIDQTANTLAMIGSSAADQRVVTLPQGVRILSIAPPLAFGEVPLRRFLLMPSGAVPRMTVLLANARGALRSVAVDPVTCVAHMETPAGRERF